MLESHKTAANSNIKKLNKFKKFNSLTKSASSLIPPLGGNLPIAKLSPSKLNVSKLRSSSSSKGIKFENYSSRKDLAKKAYSNVLSYIEDDFRPPHSINFDKLTVRGYDLFRSARISPSVGTYRPNYNTILSKSASKSMYSC